MVGTNESTVTTSPFSPPVAEANPLAGISRCIRRICLLREQDNAAEAVRLEQNEFANALRDLRLAHGPEFLPESELRALFAVEENRVADAMVLSELLLPQLAKLFPSTAPFPLQARPLSTPPQGLDSAIPFPRTATPGVSPIIADLLDAMLASERTGRRTASSDKT